MADNPRLGLLADPMPMGGGLLGNPLFNFGLGVLAAAGPSPQPVGLGQALLAGASNAQRAQQMQMQTAAQRQNLLEASRRRNALNELVESVRGTAFEPFARAAPDAFAKTILSQMLPQDRTSLQQNFEFLLSRGFTEQEALAALQTGTTVNVGAGTQPTRFLTPEEVSQVGFPAGTVATAEVTDSGLDPATVKILDEPRKETAAEAKSAAGFAVALDTLNRLEAVVRENKIEPGFIDQGGISEFLAGEMGQVVSEGAGLLGFNVGVSPAEADALSLQEQLSNQLLAAMRGASVGPEEQARFEKQLPQLWQTPEVFFANARNTRRNIQTLQKMQAGGAGPDTGPSGELSPAERAELERLRLEQR